MEIRQKERAGASSRSVEAVCTAGVRCEISNPEGHTIVTDEPEARGGTNTGPSPLACLTASLASCQVVQIVKVAEAMRFTHGAITIAAQTTTDRVAGAQGDDKVMRFSAAALAISIETDETPERIERLKALSEDRCPVGNLFADAGAEPAISWTVLPMPG
ncbi:MAG: OsmC family protein [Alphaproteobacteria bacterium]|nr:OsmC family protein [Alphaproteobacteria bacterium]